ncbi:hypothetical protein ACHWQZ_G017343 [Mnemiopsis leidyi]
MSTLSNKALAFSIQSLLSSNYNGVPSTPRREARHLSCSTESAGSLSPTCSDSSCTGGRSLETCRDPKTPKSDGSSMETCESSPEAQDQNGKKPRTIFSREQVQKLEEAYLTKRYLTRRERKELAASADISHTQVKIWFQNRRAKAKLKDRKAIALMQSAITSQRIQLYSHLPPVSLLPPLAPDSFLPPRPNNLIAPIPTKLPAIKPAANQSAFSWYL